MCFFLVGQLREQLSYLKGDNFFRFTCSDCSADGKEQSERLKLTWQQVSTKLFSRCSRLGAQEIGVISEELRSALGMGYFTLRSKNGYGVWKELRGLKKMLDANLVSS